MRWKKYDRDAPHSYSFGVFPTLELLRYQQPHLLEVLLSSAGERNKGVNKIRASCQQARIPVMIDDKLVERLSDKANTYAVGVFRKYYPTLEARANHVVLVNPADMGNLGTTLRTLIGFGLTNLALIRPAVDIFDPRVIRASMGALFQMQFAYFDSFDAYRSAFSHALYLLMTNGDTRLERAVFEPPFALVFGNESSGLPDEYRRLGTSVSIVHRPTIDSLNLPVAVGITLYEATKGQV